MKPPSKRKYAAKRVAGVTTFEAELTDLCFMVPREEWISDSAGHPVKVFTGPIIGQVIIKIPVSNGYRKIFKNITLGDIDWIEIKP